MRTLMIGIVALALAGCATPEQFRAAPPDAVLNLKRAPEQALLCMTRNLERVSGGLVSDRRPAEAAGAREMIVRETSEGTLFAIVEAAPENSGSRATVWMAALMFSTKASMIERMVAGC